MDTQVTLPRFTIEKEIDLKVKKTGLIYIPGNKETKIDYITFILLLYLNNNRLHNPWVKGNKH